MNSVVLLSLFSVTSGSRLSPWCHGQATKPYRQVTIVQRSHGTLMLLGIQSFGFLSSTLHWDHVWTGPGQFLNGRIFYLCNPFNRNRANSVTVLFTRARTNFCHRQHYNEFFLPKVRNCNPGQNILGLLRKLGAKTLLTKELIFFLLKKLGSVVIRAYFYCPPLSQAVLIVWKQNLII